VCWAGPDVRAQSSTPRSAGASAGVEQVLSTADSLRNAGRFRPALARLDSLARHHPRRADVLWRQSLCTTDIGRAAASPDTAVAYHQRALRMADRARAADSTSAWAHLVTALAAGRLTLHVGSSKRVRYSRAVKRHADRAIALDSTLAPAYHLRGRWYREVADINFVLRALVKAFYGGLPDASFEASVKDFQRAIALESKPYNHLELGKTYLEMGRTEAARRQFRRTLELSGSPFEADHKKEARHLLEQLDE
jgi:tetratricopeptide (TPR) repeat protein